MGSLSSVVVFSFIIRMLITFNFCTFLFNNVLHCTYALYTRPLPLQIHGGVYIAKVAENGGVYVAKVYIAKVADPIV